MGQSAGRWFNLPLIPSLPGWWLNGSVLCVRGAPLCTVRVYSTVYILTSLFPLFEVPTPLALVRLVEFPAGKQFQAFLVQEMIPPNAGDAGGGSCQRCPAYSRGIQTVARLVRPTRGDFVRGSQAGKLECRHAAF